MKIVAAHIKTLAVVALITVLALPAIIYLFEFYGGLSESHARWAEFGSFMGGVYAPIAAFLTLLLIAGQFRSQLEINKHQIDSTFLSNARADLHFYIEQLEKILQEPEQISNAPLSHAIITMFSSRSHDELRGAIYAKDVKRITMSDSRVSGLWGAIYAIFAGLKSVDHHNYDFVYVSSKQKCVSVFGYALCDALDNHHFVACGYPADFPYEFYYPPRGAEL